MLITNYAINNFKGAERVWLENSTGYGVRAVNYVNSAVCELWNLRRNTATTCHQITPPELPGFILFVAPLQR